MLKFEKPVVEIEKFDISDVITTSDTCVSYSDACVSDCGDYDECRYEI